MIVKTIKSSLLLMFLTMLCACKGQENSRHKTPLTHSTGESVSTPDKNIWVIYQDQKDNYWFGSNGNGVFLYDGNRIKNFTRKDGLVDSAIRGIQGDHLGNIYIETPLGISKYDGKEFTTLSPISSPSNEWQSAPNDLWFNCNGSPNDVYRYDGEFLFELQLPRQDLVTALHDAFDDPFYSHILFLALTKIRKEIYGLGQFWRVLFGTMGSHFCGLPKKNFQGLMMVVFPAFVP